MNQTTRPTVGRILVIEASRLMRVSDASGLQRRRKLFSRRPYLMSYHQSEIGMAIIKIEINTDVAISFAHSQYDKIGFSVGAPAAPDHRRVE